MYNRKIETRSNQILTAALLPLLTEKSGLFTSSALSPDLLKLYDLFAREEDLAAAIADDRQPVDRNTIDKAVAMAQELAARGFATTLVPTNDLLDIAATFYLTDPRLDPTTVQRWAARHLRELLPTITDQNNSAWTARTAAALAYFSTPSEK